MSYLGAACQDALLVALAAGAIFDVLACAALRRWLRETSPRSAERLAPITFFRPIKRGVARLREILDALVTSSCPEDQILLGVDAGAAREESVCQEVIRSFPERDISMVRCEEGAALNPKISKLIQMEPEAHHAAWLLSDSEVWFDPEFVAAFRAEWQATGCAALSAAYRCVNLRTLPQRCDALATLLALWPGLALVRNFGRVRFTLGACTLLRREALLAAGGWSAIGEMLAEDYELGAALANAGHTIRLSRQIAMIESDPISWRDYWRHQRRAALTYRVVRPAGFAGMVLTQAPVWSAVFGMWGGYNRPLIFCLILAAGVRGARVQWMARRLNFPIKLLQPCLVLASFVEALCWLGSWFSSSVWWGGRRWRVDGRGRLEAMRGD